MPSRMIRESMLASETLDQLSDFEERLGTRLWVVADDYGRFLADPRIVLAKTFPLRAQSISVDQVRAALETMQRVGYIQLYENDGHQYGYFRNWDKHQRIRSRYSKYPAPPDGSGDFRSVGDLRAIPTETRTRVLLRDRRCLACGSDSNLAVDHIIPVDAGGGPSEDNLQILCGKCNAAKRNRPLNFLNPGKEESEFTNVRTRLRNAAECSESPRHAANGGETQRNAPESRESRVESRESRVERVQGEAAGFARFWAVYPRKVGKDKAEEAWRKKRCEPIADMVVAAVGQQRAFLMREDPRQGKRAGDLCPYPATWLNRGGWKDEPETVSAARRPGGQTL